MMQYYKITAYVYLPQGSNLALIAATGTIRV